MSLFATERVPQPAVIDAVVSNDVIARTLTVRLCRGRIRKVVVVAGASAVEGGGAIWVAWPAGDRVGFCGGCQPDSFCYS
jgi:hypothetical protein